MPNTYTPIATTTLGSSISSYTFSSIPQTYTDIVLIANYGSTITEDYLKIQFNSDTSTNYSATRVDGNGSSARSTQTSNQDAFWVDWDSSCENAITKVSTVQVMNYTNSTTFKTSLVRGNRATATSPTYTGVEAMAVLWRKTPEAINSLELFMSSGNILAGSTFSLYGIAAEGTTPAAKATGGAIYSDEDYYYHSFATSGTFTPLQSLSVDYLIAAGGGGAGGVGSTWAGAGGGGGGQVLTGTSSLTATGYAITVGAGGAGGVGGTAGSTGGTSTFNSITSSAGLGGIAVNGLGNNGGASGGSFAGGTGVGTTSPSYGGGGGGGSSAVGVNAISSKAGDGGAGTSTTFLGVTSAIGGGGGGGLYNGTTFSSQGLGVDGGANGNAWISATSQNGNNAVANRAGGGGGAGGGNNGGSFNGGNGGSGIIVIRYLKV